MMSSTLLPLAVVRLEPIWKMKTALGLPWALSVKGPVSPCEDEDRYTPGVSVCPPRSVVTVASKGCPAALLYAVVKSRCA